MPGACFWTHYSWWQGPSGFQWCRIKQIADKSCRIRGPYQCKYTEILARRVEIKCGVPAVGVAVGIVGWQYHQWCCFLKTCKVRIEANFSKERGPVNVQDLCTWVVWPWLLFSCLSLNGHLALNFQTVISAPWVLAVESKIFIAFAIGRADFYCWLVTGRVRFKTLACFPASGWNHWKKYSLYFQGWTAFLWYQANKSKSRWNPNMHLF